MFCSMTWTTVLSTGEGDAPGNCVVVWMEGGAMVGYCSTGILRIDNAPPSMMRSAMTIAKIGRSTKNLDIRASPYLEEAALEEGAGASVCAAEAPLFADCVWADAACCGVVSTARTSAPGCTF